MPPDRFHLAGHAPGLHAVKEIIENQVAGAMIVQPSNAVDWKNEELRLLLDQSYCGSSDYDAPTKIKLIELLRAPIGSEFGGRRELYERTNSGSQRADAARVLLDGEGGRDVDKMKGFVEPCMSEYELDAPGPHRRRRA